MDYRSVRETSGEWNVSERWVQKLCDEKRIEGVKRFGHSWMIPADAKKPCDLRKRRKADKSEVKVSHEHQ